MLVILVTRQAEAGGSQVQGQSKQKLAKDIISKTTVKQKS
jgi:hypothetical protein